MGEAATGGTAAVKRSQIPFDYFLSMLSPVDECFGGVYIGIFRILLSISLKYDYLLLVSTICGSGSGIMTIMGHPHQKE